MRSVRTHQRSGLIPRHRTVTTTDDRVCVCCSDSARLLAWESVCRESIMDSMGADGSRTRSLRQRAPGSGEQQCDHRKHTPHQTTRHGSGFIAGNAAAAALRRKLTCSESTTWSCSRSNTSAILRSSLQKVIASTRADARNRVAEGMQAGAGSSALRERARGSWLSPGSPSSGCATARSRMWWLRCVRCVAVCLPPLG